MIIAPSSTFQLAFTTTDSMGGAESPDSLPVATCFLNGLVDSSVVASVESVGLGQYILTGNTGNAEEGDVILVFVDYYVAAQYRVKSLPTIQVSRALEKLNVGAPEDTATVVPGTPASPNFCRVYGYVIGADGRPAENAEITIELLPEEDYATVDGFAINRSVITVTTNEEGRLMDGDGNFYVDLVRTDALVPNTVAWVYKFTSESLKLEKEVALTDSLYDISTNS